MNHDSPLTAQLLLKPCCNNDFQQSPQEQLESFTCELFESPPFLDFFHELFAERLPQLCLHPDSFCYGSQLVDLFEALGQDQQGRCQVAVWTQSLSHNPELEARRLRKQLGPKDRLLLIEPMISPKLALALKQKKIGSIYSKEIRQSLNEVQLVNCLRGASLKCLQKKTLALSPEGIPMDWWMQASQRPKRSIQRANRFLRNLDPVELQAFGISPDPDGGDYLLHFHSQMILLGKNED